MLNPGTYTIRKQSHFHSKIYWEYSLCELNVTFDGDLVFVTHYTTHTLDEMVHYLFHNTPEILHSMARIIANTDDILPDDIFIYDIWDMVDHFIEDQLTVDLY
ncbi:MAG: hypothetical protein J6S67_03580 [Methanobrevibacter sp.]|nr:hypothetical protein [Methanobrevibacter sp.]